MTLHVPISKWLPTQVMDKTREMISRVVSSVSLRSRESPRNNNLETIWTSKVSEYNIPQKPSTGPADNMYNYCHCQICYKHRVLLEAGGDEKRGSKTTTRTAVPADVDVIGALLLE